MRRFRQRNRRVNKMTIYTQGTMHVEIDDATQYATIYDGEFAIATMHRRRVLSNDQRMWRAFDLFGDEIAYSKFNARGCFRAACEQLNERREWAVQRIHELTR